MSAFTYAQKDTITIGAYINSLYDFNLTENSYKSEFWLWLKYNKNSYLDSLPNQIEFLNTKYPPHVQAASTNSNDKIKWYGAKYIGEFEKHWDVNRFPFDQQKLKISVESGEYNSNHLIFKCDKQNSKLNHIYTKSLEEWEVKKYKFYTSNVRYNTSFGDPSYKQSSTYPSFNFEINIIRKDPYLVLIKLITGLIVAFVISCCVFFIKPTHVDPRFGLSVGGLFAAIGNKYIIESKVPVTNEVTLLDNIHNLTFIYILLITIISVISLHFYDKKTKKSIRVSKKIDRYAAILTISTYFIFLFSIII